MRNAMLIMAIVFGAGVTPVTSLQPDELHLTNRGPCAQGLDRTVLKGRRS